MRYVNFIQTRHKLRCISICSNGSDICLLLVVSDWPLHQPINVSPTKAFGINRVDTGLTNITFLGNYIKMGFGCIFTSADLYSKRVRTFLALVLNSSCIVLKPMENTMPNYFHMYCRSSKSYTNTLKEPKIDFPQAFEASGGTQSYCNMYKWTQEFWNWKIIQIICLCDFVMIQCRRNATSTFQNGLF